jgi:PhzF family phenazine biosynthesis protein
MKLPIYQIDAFADEVFKGNPASVVPLDSWLSNEVMQKIAQENNQAETAFYVKDGAEYHIRWFTPMAEVSLCGHATMAAAYVLFNYDNFKGDEISFGSKSGGLTVRRSDDEITLNFPSSEFKIAKLPDGMLEGLGVLPSELYQNEDYMMVLDSEEEVRSLKPNFDALKKVSTRGIIVTAKGDKVDFVSRFFAPNVGINEDPVTGSAHTTMVPYWSKKLHKTELIAEQISPRGGRVKCTDLGDRVEMAGKVVTYLVGEINI